MHILLLLSLAASLSCCGAQPRLLTCCPADFETVVEPLPAAVGDPVLLVGAGVRLRTVDFAQDSTLRAEADRLVLNQSVETSAADVVPFSGPHVVLCTDASQPLVTFSLFLSLPGSDLPAAATGAGAAAEGDLAADPRLLILALTTSLAVCAAFALAVALVVVVRNGVRHRASRPGHYRDFRHLLRASSPGLVLGSQQQKMVSNLP